MHFEKPSDISADIQEPDQLYYRLKLPFLLEDSETGFEYDDANTQHLLVLVPQYSLSEFEAYESMKVTAQMVGSGIVIWQTLVLLGL